jgi:CheY-like chemotaxis protein
VADQTKKSILFVGKDQALLDLVSAALREFDVLICRLGAEAFHALERHSIDLAIIDAKPSDLDGYDLCRRIRQGWANGPKIVLLAADDRPESRMAAYEAGADDCLANPFAPQELVAKCRVLAHLVTEEQLGQLKSQLLDMIAHELRTPLTGIVIAAETLTKDHADDQSGPWIDLIVDCAKRLELLADKGLLLCQLRSGDLSTDADNHDLSEIVRQVASERSASASAEGVGIVVADCEQAEAYIDRRCVEVLVRFLIDNALRTSRPDSAIVLSVKSDDSDVTLTLTSSGKQILPINTFSELVPRFADGEFIGADLGLGLARELMHAVDGSIELVSSRTDEASLTCYFPRARTDMRESDRRPSKKVVEIAFPEPFTAFCVDQSDTGCLVSADASFPVRLDPGQPGSVVTGTVVRVQMRNGHIGFGIAFDAGQTMGELGAAVESVESLVDGAPGKNQES